MVSGAAAAVALAGPVAQFICSKKAVKIRLSGLILDRLRRVVGAILPDFNAPNWSVCQWGLATLMIISNINKTETIHL